MKQVKVAVGVVLRGEMTFLTRRLAHQHQGGKWEFPGGKIEAGETTEQALTRELAEEIGIEVHSSEPLVVIEHQYPDKHVMLDVHTVNDFSGEPQGLEGQEGQWVALNDLDSMDFPEANKEIITRLLD
ncbi:8-oxo-dGTP diphosphatase MutT [Paraneptunicella aestuarii]|uniref:8-oxo-dGTP diphosphatase MutT n=1 Tax=Paraneptunicella aestuarii TaxID=2831148 RepID=UPI001E367473|nr:8-oxo-dGTP diphosphatase MutT [Paraneptunicella aestuarii]UAA38081.1 8-oxo-dGTP diphosphatase MutT [Paraneptunicella aestuarii]